MALQFGNRFQKQLSVWDGVRVDDAGIQRMIEMGLETLKKNPKLMSNYVLTGDTLVYFQKYKSFPDKIEIKVCMIREFGNIDLKDFP